MNKYNALLGLGFIALLLTGCSGSAGQFHQATGTAVSLKENNYKIVKAGATGQSSGFALFGLIPFVSPSYADAKAELYKSAGEALEGRSIALANQTEDRSVLYLILFSIPKVTITADIIEFIEKK